jgi:aminoglycoside phosphotransferase family enzyme/predicted kinase
MHDSSTQEAVFALLSNPAAHRDQAVKRIDTHAASVFLAGDRAYKVKRAVRFPFLDYSTLPRRMQACEAELAVNRRLAPDIYLRVLPITRERDGRLALGGAGVPIEWVVEMRRFDENATLDHLADAGQVDARLADALGRAVAAAHANASIVVAEPWIAALASYIEQNNAAFQAEPELFPSALNEALAQASRAAHARIRPLLIKRGRHGLIRRGHGDLHLGNIVLHDGRPVLFDAIEFNPLIASGDVLYDLAFLLMDLAERGLNGAANIVFNRYLVETRRLEDLDGLAGLPLFLSVRAAIRAKVTAARRMLGGGEGAAAIERTARNYFDFANRFIEPPAPMMIAIGGLSGTGKSLLARALAPDIAPAPGAVVLRSDVERKALFGMEEHDQLEQSAYTDEVTTRVYTGVADKARRALNAGHSVVVDAVFARPQERALMHHTAQSSGAQFHGMFLSTDLASRLARIGMRSHDASDADALVARRQENYDLGTMEWTRVDASGTPEETLPRASMVIGG